ncbi:hypothetical protein ES288_D07G223100v1 [Gossypium darwinii]|uniref:Uncharacterized protein n=1 Tax=Gossypium darwinii TaxID=34276 RepID=A0A5D2C223_GOSDA|nr:hypothetical protein ES288_D07G223100v1 [Gossypium darwinii]
MSRATSASPNSDYGGVNQDAAFPPIRYGVQGWGRGMYRGEGAHTRARHVRRESEGRHMRREREGRHCCSARNPCC